MNSQTICEINQRSLRIFCMHYSDIIISMMASQITSLTIVYSTVYSGADQRKHQTSTSLTFVRGNWWPVNSPHKGPVMWKMFPFHNVIMWRFLIRQILEKVECVIRGHCIRKLSCLMMLMLLLILITNNSSGYIYTYTNTYTYMKHNVIWYDTDETKQTS